MAPTPVETGALVDRGRRTANRAIRSRRAVPVVPDLTYAVPVWGAGPRRRPTSSFCSQDLRERPRGRRRRPPPLGPGVTFDHDLGASGRLPQTGEGDGCSTARGAFASGSASRCRGSRRRLVVPSRAPAGLAMSRSSGDGTRPVERSTLNGRAAAGSNSRNGHRGGADGFRPAGAPLFGWLPRARGCMARGRSCAVPPWASSTRPRTERSAPGRAAGAAGFSRSGLTMRGRALVRDESGPGQLESWRRSARERWRSCASAGRRASPWWGSVSAARWPPKRLRAMATWTPSSCGTLWQRPELRPRAAGAHGPQHR